VTYHISIQALYSVDPSKTSGGRYHSVTTSFEYVFVGTLLARASPKSASFSSPFSLMSRFWGFKSLCRRKKCSFKPPETFTRFSRNYTTKSKECTLKVGKWIVILSPKFLFGWFQEIMNSIEPGVLERWPEADSIRWLVYQSRLYLSCGN